MPALIPRPVQMTAGEGAFALRDPVTIAADSGKRVGEIATLLAEAIRRGSGYRVTIVPAGRPAAITLRTEGASAAVERYRLDVRPGGIEILGASTSGLLWGVQTLRQLLPPAFERTGARQAAWEIPAVAIVDQPRYPWRGAMMDVARHLFPVSAIKRQIDILSRYKANVFHWHLVDDQGWRIQIRKHPRLTTVGGWRTEADGTRYGGFYTQAEVREVVEYARLRGITVVPEIEMPGHARAALAAYPALGCTGERLPVPATWGVFADVFCPAEPTFRFLEEVLTEVLALFPSPWIHIGGDEVPKERWKACAPCQAIIRREGLRDEEELQHWFTSRIATWLRARGRTMVGWDEILEGGLAPGAVVQAWQNSSRVKAALEAGAPVIASPSEWVYLDASPASKPTDRVIAFDPRAGLAESLTTRILGGEAPLWTEHVISAVNYELIAFPRLIAFAEAVWSGPATGAEWRARFDARERDRLLALGAAVGPHDQDLARLRFEWDATAGALRPVATTAEGVTTRWRTAKVERGAITEATRFTPDLGAITIQSYYGATPILAPRRIEMVSHLATGKTVRLASAPDRRYAGTGPYTLTDGAHGSAFADGFFNGFLGKDLDATIDLGAERPVREVAITVLEEVRSWITYPSAVRVAHSRDGVSWSEIPAVTLPVAVDPEGRGTRRVRVALPPGTIARHVRVVAVHRGPLPAWHAGKGQPSWVFADEIEVR